MTHQRNIIKRLAVIGVVVTAVAGAWASPASASGRGQRSRAGTARYHNLATAMDEGYGLFTDAAGIACIDDPAGGMGIHYAKGSLVVDGDVDASTPEALVYEPQENGRLRLVAVEYVVFQADWDATHNGAPELFGEEFEAVGADNRYGLPPFYELHAWLWKHNPKGTFGQDWNPNVSCAGAQAQGSSSRRARASARSISWTPAQLEQLATAYAKKNPGWSPSAASAVTSPAQQDLDAAGARRAGVRLRRPQPGLDAAVVDRVDPSGRGRACLGPAACLRGSARSGSPRGRPRCSLSIKIRCTRRREDA